MRMVYVAYMRSAEWQAKRLQYFNSKQPQGCQGCGVTGPGLHLHHRTYERLGKEWLKDLVPVCSACHRKIHRGFNMFLFDLSDRTDRVLKEVRKSASQGVPYQEPKTRVSRK